MEVEIIEDPIATIAALGSIPIAFEVDRVFDVSPGDGDAGFILMPPAPADTTGLHGKR